MRALSLVLLLILFTPACEFLGDSNSSSSFTDASSDVYDPASPCEGLCSRLRRDQCISAEQHARCFGLCNESPDLVQEQFASCVVQSPVCETDCYETLTLTSCLDACDDQHERCASSEQHAQCFQGCREAEQPIREQFVHCATSDDFMWCSTWENDSCIEAAFGNQ
ncbi:MAG: hypothetical protein KC561_14595 [Myxococcales bacterium]|nr:hypothetical protein [Myxococcales bacterium]